MEPMTLMLNTEQADDAGASSDHASLPRTREGAPQFLPRRTPQDVNAAVKATSLQASEALAGAAHTVRDRRFQAGILCRKAVPGGCPHPTTSMPKRQFTLAEAITISTESPRQLQRRCRDQLRLSYRIGGAGSA